mgnify:CR=1 FL=1
MIVMKIDGIPGDCNIADHEGWIVVDSLSWEITREEKESGKQGTKDINLGVAELPALTMGKSMDKASVFLMQNSIAGSALGTVATIELLATAGLEGAPACFLRYKLERPIIKSWSIDASDDDRPTESVSILYNKIHMEYFATEDGKTYTSAGNKGWDVVTGKSWGG